MASRAPGTRAFVGQLLRSSKPSRSTRAPSTFLARCPPSLAKVTPRSVPHARHLSTTRNFQEEPKNTSTSPSQPSHRKYTFPEIQSLTSNPRPNTLLIDVREPSELQSSGRIPAALNLPLKTSPDFMFLDAEEFEDRFGRPRPGKEDEVIFYCRSGVRSKAAAELAKQAGFGGTVSEFPGSWLEWEKEGGAVER